MWKLYGLLSLVYLAASGLPFFAPAGSNLEYEYALYATISILLILPAMALIFPKKIVASIQIQNFDFTSYFWVFILGPFIGLLPGIIYFAGGQCLCSQPGHYFWMGIQWYPAWILAHATFFALIRSRQNQIHRMKLLSVWLLTLVVLISMLVFTMWTAPQKRTLHFLAGFLHGPIYDEWIGLDTSMIVGRLAHGFLATFLLLLALFKNKTAHICACIILAGSWFVASVTASRSPSIGSGSEKLEEALPNTIKGDGFTLHYLNPNSDQKIPIELQRLARDTQFHVNELKEMLKEPTLPFVNVFAYPDSDTKKLWFGGGSTDVADVYTPSIHITVGEWPHPTLRHELAHALTSGFAFHGLGFHPNMAFTEGLAVAIAPNDRALSLDESAASLIASGRIKNIEDIFSPIGFWKESGSRAYSVAGSLIQYLIKTKGIASVKSLYSGKSWEEANGESEQQTLARWQAHIKSTYDANKSGIQAESLFRYPGILKEQCPHSKADLRRPRSEGLLTRLRQPTGWDPDADYQSWLLSLDPKDLDTRLSIWKTESKKVCEERVPVVEKVKSWRETVAQARSWPPKALEDIELALLDSDLRRVEGDRDSSIVILNELINYVGKTSVSDHLLRQIGARLEVENKLSDPIALEWRKYLAGWRRVLPEAKNDEPWLLTYLRMRRAPATEMADPGMLRILSDAPIDDSFGATKNSFQLEWYKMIVARLMSIQSYADAGEVYKKMAQSASEGRKDLLQENQRRAAFYATLPPLEKNIDKNSKQTQPD